MRNSEGAGRSEPREVDPLGTRALGKANKSRGRAFSCVAVDADKCPRRSVARHRKGLPGATRGDKVGIGHERSAASRVILQAGRIIPVAKRTAAVD